jgi:DNA-binding CsgD family transcriptional regulator
MTLVPKLTPMQAAILRMLADDMTDKNIGAALGRSPRTIEKHLGALRRKLGARSRVGVAVAAARLGLL